MEPKAALERRGHSPSPIPGGRAVSRRALVLSVSIACCWGVLSAPAGAGGLCHEAPRPFDAHTQVVPIEDYCFTPVVVRIKAKQSITWINRDMDAHTVTGVGMGWGSLEQNLNHRDRVAYSFATDGVYPYFCALHPGMVGAVVVGDGVPRTGTAPREGRRVSFSPGTVTSASRDATASSASEATRGPSSSASESGATPWLWAAPIVLAAGGAAVALDRRRRKLA